MFRRITSRDLKDIGLAALFTLCIIWLVWLVWGIFWKEETARQAADVAHAELVSLEQREATIRQDLNTLQTPRGQDAALRTAFGVAKPGEEVIIVVPPQSTTTPTTTPSWWSMLWSWL